jgi:hypothetical protein
LFGVVTATALVFYTYDYIVVSTAPYVYGAFGLAAYRFLTFKWGFDTVYNRFLNKPLLRGAYAGPFILVDKGLLEQAGPTGLGKLAHQIGRCLTKLQTGRVYDYGASFLLSTLVGNLLMGSSGIEVFVTTFCVVLLPYQTKSLRVLSTFFMPFFRVVARAFVGLAHLTAYNSSAPRTVVASLSSLHVPLLALHMQPIVASTTSWNSIGFAALLVAILAVFPFH